MESVTLESLVQSSLANPELLTIEATVTSGLETVAECECLEVIGKTTPVVSDRGRVYFNIPRDELHKVFSMRSIDNVHLIVFIKKCLFISNKEDDLSILLNCYSEIGWEKPISVWQDVYKFSGTLYPTKEEYEENRKIYDELNKNNPKKCKLAKTRNTVCENNEESGENYPDVDKMRENLEDSISVSRKNIGDLDSVILSDRPAIDDAVLPESNISIPKFRVSSRRVGSHTFSSDDVAKAYGALIQEDFLWIVDLTEFNMEIVTSITDADFIISISLTKASLHRRNLTALGWTSLRATICYGLIKIANPQAGEIVVDPLAGSGSIPIEGASAFPQSYFMAGDIKKIACGLTKKNVENMDLEKKLNLDILWWDTLTLPFRDSSVDVIVTDLPFGKRSGSKKSNSYLYPCALREFARVVRKGSGRAVILSGDRRNLVMANQLVKHLWSLAERRHINVGGIKALVFLLRRTLLD